MKLNVILTIAACLLVLGFASSQLVARQRAAGEPQAFPQPAVA